MDEYGDSYLTPENIFKKLTSFACATHFVVGYSGGVDSHVLLHIMHSMQIMIQTRKEFNFKISALHIHHGLSPNADRWAEHCEKICAEYSVPLNIVSVNAKVYGGRSPEEVAREARFHAFEQFLKEETCLVLAHHAEDQAETLLLRLFRGTGPKGLKGISEHAVLGQGELCRPLLGVSKKDILAYAKAHSLTWVEDDSNQDPRFDRNFLRQDILPKLVNRWPGLISAINRLGSLCQESESLVHCVAKQDYENAKGVSKNSLSVVYLLNIEPVRRHALIRFWLETLGVLLPSFSHMQRIEKEILGAKAGAKPKLKLGDYELCRLQKDLCCIKLEVGASKKRIKLESLN